MKHFITKTTAFLFLAISLLAGCKKLDDLEPPQPLPAGASFVQLVLDKLPGDLPYGTSSLNAVVSIANDKNEEVVQEKMLTLSFNGQYLTEKVQLPLGAYHITRFRIVYGSVNTRFATPMSHSARATEVQKPLPVAFSLATSGTTSSVPLEVIGVGANDRPEQFGYPSGAFDNNQSNNDPNIKVKVRAVVKVGDITYDSIPGSYVLSVWNASQQMTTSYGHLKPGTNEINLPKSHVKYEIRMTSLGVTDKITLLKSELQGGEEYILGGEKAPKLLKSEMTYTLIEGLYVPQSKNEYVYDGNGKLVKVIYQQKDKDNRPFIAMTDELVYSNGKVKTINRYNEKNSLLGFTDFVYNAQGKVIRMKQKSYDQETEADVAYVDVPAEGRSEVGISYRYNHADIGMRYVMQFYGDNRLTDNSHTDNYKSEAGLYNYDTYINPYIHMNWPDLFLSRSSKNNLTGQSKTYSGAYPVAVPYSFKYRYDGDGYPTELVKEHKSYLTNQFLYTSKTVYIY